MRRGTPNLYSKLEKQWDCWHTGKQHFITEEHIDKSPDTMIKWNTMRDYGAFLKKARKKRPGGEAFKSACPEMVLGKTTRRRRYSIPHTAVYEEGFDYFYDGYVLDASLKAIRNRDENKPFFLNVNFQATHPPYHIPEPYYSMLKNVELPENVGRWSEGQSPLQLYNLPGFLGSRYTIEDWKGIWRVFMGFVALLDHCVGEIVSELKEEGMYDDTLIVFTADHGEMLGSHCMWQKMCMYEESTHIPLYIKLPKGEEFPESTDAVASHIDVFPTLCDYLAIEPPSDLSGVSLRPLIEGEMIDRDRVFVQFDGNGARGNFQRCVVNGNYKLNVDLFKDEIYFELYDVVNDKQELKNLAFDNKKKARELFPLILEFMKATGDLLEIPRNAYETFLQTYSKLR